MRTYEFDFIPVLPAGAAMNVLSVAGMAIGANFGTSESAVLHACRKVTERIKRNRKLRKKIDKIDKKLNSVKIQQAVTQIKHQGQCIVGKNIKL